MDAEKRELLAADRATVIPTDADRQYRAALMSNDKCSGEPAFDGKKISYGRASI